MQYVIYGAGETGKKAFEFLGPFRVGFFATSDSVRKEPVLAREVLAYQEMTALSPEETIIVVASALYWREMSAKLEGDGIHYYFVFNEGDAAIVPCFFPRYIIWHHMETQSYTQILSRFGISKYKSIAIYGTNYALPYLISEIAMQCGHKTVSGIWTDEHEISTWDINQTIGVPLKPGAEAMQGIDCLVLNCRRDQSEIHEWLDTHTHDFDVLDLYDYDEHIPEFQHPELEKFRNIHKGKRCFLIGNGPSLRISDLETLYAHHEITFAFNMIYKIFDKTAWRPTYYCISDGLIYCDCINHLDFDCGEIFLVDEYHRMSDRKLDGAYYVHYNVRPYAPCHPRFSEDVRSGVFWGKTVVYDIGLQFAAWMGFSEIYLLGVDNSMTGKISAPENHFIPNYCDTKYDVYTFNSSDTELAFESALRWSKAHGVRIYNATRGGKLEVFERVEFDSLFHA